MHTTFNNLFRALLILSLISSANANAVEVSSIGFDDGSNSGFIGNAFFEASGGNPDGNAHFFVEAFGISLRTGGIGEPANPGFLGDYSGLGSVTFSFDVQVNSIAGFSGEIPRSIGIALIDRDIMGDSGASGVFFELDVISSATHFDWVTLSTTISNTSALDLPPGWIGFGSEDANTFEPVLPEGASFASVLAGVDEFQITTFVPGFVFGFTNYDVRIDNVAISTVPVPAAAGLLGAALISLLGMRRKNKSPMN